MKWAITFPLSYSQLRTRHFLRLMTQVLRVKNNVFYVRAAGTTRVQWTIFINVSLLFRQSSLKAYLHALFHCSKPHTVSFPITLIKAFYSSMKTNKLQRSSMFLWCWKRGSNVFLFKTWPNKKTLKNLLQVIKINLSVIFFPGLWNLQYQGLEKYRAKRKAFHFDWSKVSRIIMKEKLYWVN